MASYKTILTNMVDSEVTRFAEKHTDGEHVFYDVIDGTMTMETGKKDQPVHWSCDIRQIGKIGNNYHVAGYISDWGTVHICLVSFERTYCDADGSNRRTKYAFIHGEKLETFAFDK